MKILITSDHAGFELKNELFLYVKELGYDIADQGPFEYHSEDDYPDFVVPVARAVSQYPGELKAIIIGGSGQGEAIIANRFKNIRAVVYNAPNLNIIKLSREHNDANILSLGARFLTAEEAREAVKLWLETEFSNINRHYRRIQKIELLSAPSAK
ncbi:MAG: RpiB/LacA/LacB family sugar-phosphate isomerase [Patescibacteria group bacterium]